MNRDLSDLPGAGDQHDPVADFFAAERADVRALPSDPEHWEAIVREGRRPVRHSWLPYAGAAAAAVIIVGAVAWGGMRGGGPATDPASASSSYRPNPVTSTVTVTATPAPSPTGGPSPTSSAPVVLPVPRTFDLVSMTNAGGKHLFALGAATCATGDCVQVVASEDDGRTWTRRSAFTDLTTPGARVTPDRAHQVVGIRFATPDIGYLFGSTVKRTTDGGRTWTDVDVDRRVVLSLETDGKRVWMATARSCEHSPSSPGCTDLQPRTGDVRSASTSAVPVSGMPAAGADAWISMDGSEAYYNVTGTDATPDVPVRLSGTPTVLRAPDGCADQRGAWVSGTANARGTLVALCPSSKAPDTVYALATSPDGGRTWTSRPVPGLGAPGAGAVWLSAVDAKRLVVVRGGQPGSTQGSTQGTTAPPSSALLSTSDGGATWHDAHLGGSVAWSGAAGGGLVYALGGGLSYWQSTDAGATFETVPMTR